MINKRLLAIVTMMVMTGSHAHAQAQPFSIDQLRAIEALISGKDCGALYSYLEANPRMTLGPDPLAVELRSFRQDVDMGRLDCFAPQRLSFQGGVAGAADRAAATQSASGGPSAASSTGPSAVSSASAGRDPNPPSIY
jgi:hypothetical protein